MFMRTDTLYHVNYWLKRGYSEEESINMVEKSKKETSWRCKEFWIKRGYNESEALNHISKKQSEISYKRDRNKKYLTPYDEQYYINKGIIDSDEINNLINEFKNKTNPYNKWTHEELKKIINKRRLTYYKKSKIERNIINKTRGLTKKELFERFGEERTSIILKNRGNGARRSYEKKFSKISMELFDILSEMNKDKIFLYGKNEKFIPIKGLINKKGYFIDFLFIKEKKIIEFNGDFWHFNPLKYISESFYVLNGNKVIAQDVWNQDSIKINSLKNNGFDILVIWENDYNIDKKMVIKKCNKFLNK